MDDYTRREFVRTSLPGFLGLALALPGLTSMATRANAQDGRADKDRKINWGAFLEGVAKEAAKQHLDDWSEVAYLARAEAVRRACGSTIRFSSRPSRRPRRESGTVTSISTASNSGRIFRSATCSSRRGSLSDTTIIPA